MARAIRLVQQRELGGMLAMLCHANSPAGSAAAAGSAEEVVALGDYLDVSVESDWYVGVVTDIGMCKSDPPRPRVRVRIDGGLEHKGSWVYFESDPPRLAALGAWTSLKVHRWTDGQLVDVLRFSFDDLLGGTWVVAEVAETSNRKVVVRFQGDGSTEELDMSDAAAARRVTKPFTRSASATPHETLAHFEADGGTAATAQSVDARFARALAAQGLDLHEVDADGNCLYRAVAHQIFGDAELYAVVRAAVCDYLAQYLVLFTPYMGGTLSAAKEYVAEMRADGAWGGALELRALEGVYDRSIDVYSTADLPPLRSGGASDGGECSIMYRYI